MSELSGLSLDQTPTISVPLRTFLTAPCVCTEYRLAAVAEYHHGGWHPSQNKYTTN